MYEVFCVIWGGAFIGPSGDEIDLGSPKEIGIFVQHNWQRSMGRLAKGNSLGKKGTGLVSFNRTCGDVEMGLGPVNMSGAVRRDPTAWLEGETWVFWLDCKSLHFENEWVPWVNEEAESNQVFPNINNEALNMQVIFLQEFGIAVIKTIHKEIDTRWVPN